ncbi:MAG: DNA-3-methyladenine glycosylase 2 family protein [Clostridiales bacterium]|nr:DNA-3-methyladenine glycosylase 2 family protein [Clostridiales bacterium]
MYFSYGEMELDHLKKADEKLGRAIDHIGMVYRPVMDDLFACLVQKILGQQVSSAAQMTVWNRMLHRLGQVSPEGILSLSRNELQQLGMTYRKADHIRSLSQKVFDGTLVLDRLYGCSDSEVIRQLSSLDGIGPWTAEMVLAFCMQRPDVFSFGDLGIHKGLRMLHGLPKIDRVQFEELRRRYSPCGTTASLYLWEIAKGALPGLSDPGQKKEERK